MISLTCTNCKTVLSIDDAFAGGVCRCQHCGTIQTVPSRLKHSGEAQNAPPAPTPPKTLYQHRARSESGTGLDELADVVTSSGIAGSGLSSSGQRGSKQHAAVAKANRTQTLLAIAGASILLLIGAVVWLATNRAAPVADVVHDVRNSAPVAVEPLFLNVPLEGNTIVYLLDRGGGTQKAFGDLKEAALRSLATLGPDCKFQIVFWNNGTDEAFPSGSPTYATRPNLEAARRSLDNVSAFGKTDVASAMKKAMEAKPTDIVVATGKAWDLDDTFVAAVKDRIKEADVRLHTLAVGGSGASEAFKTLAAQTGGHYLEISESELRASVK